MQPSDKLPIIFSIFLQSREVWSCSPSSGVGNNRTNILHRKIYKEQKRMNNFPSIPQAQASPRKPFHLKEISEQCLNIPKPTIKGMINIFQRTWENTFSYQDQVTLQKYNIASLQPTRPPTKTHKKNRSMEDPPTRVRSPQYQQKVMNRFFKKVKDAGNFTNDEAIEIAKCLRKIKFIKEERNNEVILCKRRAKNKTLQNSIIENAMLAKKEEKQLKAKADRTLYEINLNRFRNSCENDSSSRNIFNTPISLDKLEDKQWELQKKDIWDREIIKRKNTKRERAHIIKPHSKPLLYTKIHRNKIEQNPIDEFVQEYEKLIPLRLRHEAEYNWQKGSTRIINH